MTSGPFFDFDAFEASNISVRNYVQQEILPVEGQLPAHMTSRGQRVWQGWGWSLPERGSSNLNKSGRGVEEVWEWGPFLLTD